MNDLEVKMVTVRKNFLTIGVAASISFAPAAISQTPPAAAQAAYITYADLADLALAAPIAAIVTVDRAVRLKDADAAGVAPGRVRFYLQGRVDTLIAGSGGLSAAVSWVAEVPLTSANRPPKLKRQRVILLARPAGGDAGALQLVSPAAQIAWTPAIEQRLRAILTEKTGRTAPPAITGVGHAFHVAGSIPGEGETQIFLKTGDGRPVSLSILRRPGEAPRWSVALGEMVDDAATAPARDTLLWYRLACGLPRALPDDAVADQQPDDAAQARADYDFVVSSLGACGRAS